MGESGGERGRRGRQHLICFLSLYPLTACVHELLLAKVLLTEVLLAKILVTEVLLAEVLLAKVLLVGVFLA